MSEMDDLRARVEALEAEMERVREQAGSAHTLAALADRDAAEVRATGRANNQLLTALRETQREQGEAIRQLAEGQAVLQRAVQAVAELTGDIATGQTALQEGQRELLAEIRRLRESR
ncbi:hypothetical protein ACIRD3_39495 [Kitasatospora sp. NPDC093550]|uniref:hypothetical protein n=1 Tax=Kitasatospora sp. NPDC093550 TaxID=3364089 RepID=UPI003805D6E9